MSDGIYFVSMDKLIILFANVLINNKELISADLFLIHLIHCLLCIVGVFKTNIPIIFAIALFILLNRCWLDFPKFRKHIFQTIIISSLREIFDKEIVELICALLLAFSICFLFMLVYFNFLTLNLLFIHLLDCEICFFFCLELYIGISSALSIRICF